MSKITISPMHGRCVVSFLKNGLVVHHETFEGKTTVPYTRSLPAGLAFDSHRLSMALGELGSDEGPIYRVHD